MTHPRLSRTSASPVDDPAALVPNPLRDPSPSEARCYRFKRNDETEFTPSGSPIRPAANPPSEGPPPDVAGFGMKLFLASLTVVFASTFVAYGIMRWRNRDDWESIVDGREITALAVATLLLVVADICSMRALKRADTRAAARRLTLMGAVAATIYMFVQLSSWLPLWRMRDPVDGGDLTMPGVVFLMVTFAHAMHVAGGIITNAIVLLTSNGGKGPARNVLRLVYQYWRFLTVMWVAVLVLLAV